MCEGVCVCVTPSSLQTANMYFLEAYKGRRDKIALCEGKLSSESNFRVLQVGF